MSTPANECARDTHESIQKLGGQSTFGKMLTGGLAVDYKGEIKIEVVVENIKMPFELGLNRRNNQEASSKRLRFNKRTLKMQKK